MIQRQKYSATESVCDDSLCIDSRSQECYITNNLLIHASELKHANMLKKPKRRENPHANPNTLRMPVMLNVHLAAIRGMFRVCRRQ